MATESYLTPPELAELWGVDADKVLQFIHRGELRAVNLAINPQGKPRFRIALEEVRRFEQARATKPPEAKPRRRRRAAAVAVKEYF